jgi:hypothetical protein
MCMKKERQWKYRIVVLDCELSGMSSGRDATCLRFMQERMKELCTTERHVDQFAKLRVILRPVSKSLNVKIGANWVLQCSINKKHVSV